MKSQRLRLLEGILKRHPDGFAFFIPDDSSHPDVYIPSGKIGSALSNDRVQVRVHQKRGGGPRSCFGFVHSILKRNRAFVVGFFTVIKDQGFMERHNLGCPENVPLDNPKKTPVQKGDCIKAKIKFHSKGDSFFTGDIVENFGPVSSSAKDDVKRVMAELDIPFGFSKESLTSADRLPDQVTERDYSDRKDLRDKAFVTIDGASAQDFDDAVFVERHPRFYRLYVAIADVSHYVQEDSVLDEEAFERGNSTYFPGFCSPMLPEKLSNNLCSLKPKLPRLAMVQEMDFDFQGERIGEDIYPAVIESRYRLTYGQAQDILDAVSSLKGDFLESLKPAGELAQILLKRHIREQALDLDIPETLVLLNEKGETEDILKEQRLFSHQMIEQFMLSANKAVSAFLEKKQISLLYRIHESPELEKLKSLQKFSQILGFSKPFKKRENLIRFLSQYKDHEKTPLIHKLILRSLQQARYSAFNKGHYGLNFSSYTHFTSPIRRYCDLLIHRLIKKALSQDSPAFLSQKELEKQAKLISAREQNSVKAERRLKDIKRARFLQKHLGEKFSGYVSSVSSFGLFITLRQFDVEGLVRFQDLRGFWEADELGLFAKNRHSSYRIHFGDEAEVLVVKSDASTGKVDFRLLGHKGRKF